MLIVNRFEGDYAVCENEAGELTDIHKSKIPQNAREGSVLSFHGMQLVVDQAQTANRREKIVALRKKLRENNKEV
ncbi:MAG: DUF3006 domain-containing protein [Oscillospiraceae bacterium]|jgi:hypothetical protein